MTNMQLIKYLKNIIDNFSFTDSFVDESRENTICIYQRNGSSPFTKRVGFKFYPATMVVTGDEHPGNTQKKMNNIFEKLYEKETQEIDDIQFLIIIKNNPVFLGRTDAGYFRYALDLDIYFTKGE